MTSFWCLCCYLKQISHFVLVWRWTSKYHLNSHENHMNITQQVKAYLNLMKQVPRWVLKKLVKFLGKHTGWTAFKKNRTQTELLSYSSHYSTYRHVGLKLWKNRSNHWKHSAKKCSQKFHKIHMERLTCETIHLWETSKSPGDSSLKIYLTYSFFDLNYNLKQIFCKTPLLAFSRDFDSMSRKK